MQLGRGVGTPSTTAKKSGQRIQFWAEQQRALPTIRFLLFPNEILEEGEMYKYIRDPDLYRAAWFLALPYPMNRVLVLIYPKHQISPLL